MNDKETLSDEVLRLIEEDELIKALDHAVRDIERMIRMQDQSVELG